jgi:hypothetical protein
MNKAPKTLTSIFANTDNVCYGPFTIVKNTGEDFGHAKFMVDGVEVPMQVAQKKVMALLISQQGRILSFQDLAEGMETEKFNQIAQNLREGSRVVREKAQRQGKNAFSAHISLIRKALINVFGPGTPETIRYLGMFETIRMPSSHLRIRNPRSGYRLYIDAPNADLS